VSEPGRSEDDLDSIAHLLHDTLSNFFRDNAEGMVIKWTLQAEVIDNDGTSAMWTLATPGMAVWEKMMLPRYHEKYQELLLAEAIRRENDD
jgi:hypothetical protein